LSERRRARASHAPPLGKVVVCSTSSGADW
jgi:hypothetical protein